MAWGSPAAQNRNMARTWVLALIVAVVALVYLVRRILNESKSLEHEVDLPLWDAEHYGHVAIHAALNEDSDDTAPTVLSPPESRVPKTGSGQSR